MTEDYIAITSIADAQQITYAEARKLYEREIYERTVDFRSDTYGWCRMHAGCTDPNCPWWVTRPQEGSDVVTTR